MVSEVTPLIFRKVCRAFLQGSFQGFPHFHARLAAVGPHITFMVGLMPYKDWV